MVFDRARGKMDRSSEGVVYTGSSEAKATPGSQSRQSTAFYSKDVAGDCSISGQGPSAGLFYARDGLDRPTDDFFRAQRITGGLPSEDTFREHLQTTLDQEAARELLDGPGPAGHSHGSAASYVSEQRLFGCRGSVHDAQGLVTTAGDPYLAHDSLERSGNVQLLGTTGTPASNLTGALGTAQRPGSHGSVRRLDRSELLRTSEGGKECQGAANPYGSLLGSPADGRVRLGLSVGIDQDLETLLNLEPGLVDLPPVAARLSWSPLPSNTPTFKTAMVTSRTQNKQLLMKERALEESRREQAQALEQEQALSKSQETQTRPFARAPPHAGFHVDVPRQVLQVKTSLTHPTQYHMNQKRKMQVWQYLDELRGSVASTPPATTVTNSSLPLPPPSAQNLNLSGSNRDVCAVSPAMPATTATATATSSPNPEVVLSPGISSGATSNSEVGVVTEEGRHES